MSDLASIQNRLDQHEREIALIGRSTQQMIDSQKELTESINDLTLNLSKYVERMDRSGTDITEIKAEQKVHTEQIAAIRIQNSANQQVIDGVKSLNSKAIWFILVAILTPIVSAGFISSRIGGG